MIGLTQELALLLTPTISSSSLYYLYCYFREYYQVSYSGHQSASLSTVTVQHCLPACSRNSWIYVSQWVTTVAYTQQRDSQCLYPVFLEAQLQAIVQLSRHQFTIQCSMFKLSKISRLLLIPTNSNGKAVMNMNISQFQNKAKDGLYPDIAMLWTHSCFSPGSWLLIHSNEVHGLASLTLGLVLVLLKSVARRTSETSFSILCNQDKL